MEAILILAAQLFMMDFELFTALVGVLAVVYAGTAKFIQNKLIDRSKIKGIQEESKKLNEDMKKAKERNDKAAIDKIMKKQMEFLPKMNTMMFAQFKPMIFVLAIFFAFTWMIGQIDPTVSDDITIQLLDDGYGCDDVAEDGVYSGCLEPENSGKWIANVKAYRNGGEVGHNSTFFAYAQEIDDSYLENAVGEPIVVNTDKKNYVSGETVKIYASANDVSMVEAKFDNATAFRVDLPLTIPILNVSRIYQPYWFFILISLISNLGIGFVLGKLQKK
ncbi:DUF106 domain-containing protein [Candidatus Micrarchaeota archaeon]|nr:DUF106 domain-containing protein [Candidatus Micrarchaeota archaeon]